MKEQVKLVVLLPVGALSSKNQLSFIVDTIESIIHYTTPDRRIVIQDNSSPLHLGSKLIQRFPGTHYRPGTAQLRDVRRTV
ncbi:MAG: hypothetical protein IPK19_05615 [Chloroflexi bacterium]|nr:hypothetical protein [Chloroflexota bacterium]